MNERSIAEDDVINTILYPEMIRKVNNAYYARKKIISGYIEVIYIK